MQAVVRQHLKADLLGVSGNWRNLQSFGNTYANERICDCNGFFSSFIVLGVVSAGENPCKGRECPSLYAPYFGIEGDILVLVWWSIIHIHMIWCNIWMSIEYFNLILGVVVALRFSQALSATTLERHCLANLWHICALLILKPLHLINSNPPRLQPAVLALD